MNNLAKFTIGIFVTLGFAWLAFVVGARSQYGDLVPTASILEDDGSVPSDADLFPMPLSGIAQQGAEEYAALGCVTCHTQQIIKIYGGNLENYKSLIGKHVGRRVGKWRVDSCACF